MAHISLVTLGVADLAAATTFYEALGWRRSSASVTGEVTFLQGSPVLALFGLADLRADAALPAPADEAASPRSALAMNLASHDAVDEFLDSARAAGAGVCQPARRTDWGGYSGYFQDLDGHLWEVAHNPFFALGADGSVTLPD